MSPEVKAEPVKNKGGRPKNCGKCNKVKKACKCGRPTKLTKDVLKKLEEAFLMGCSDLEACLLAEINARTLYFYQKKNPEFVQRKAMLKKNPTVKARKTIYKALDQVEDAKWYVTRKEKNEFAPRNEFTGEGGSPLEIKIISYADASQLPAKGVPAPPPESIG